MPVVLTRATQQAAGYRPVGGIERCAYCRFYGSANNCGRILGPVSPAGWCRFFSRMVWLRMDGGDTDMGILGPPGVTLDLSFMGGTLPSGVTFTRASTATYFNSAGTMQTAATNAPRYDYNPSTLALNGLLIEESRTNVSSNSNMVGGVAGTPGTDPTGWNLSAGLGLSKQIVGVGTANGIPYIDVRYFGTATAGNFFPIFAGSSATATTAGTPWTISSYFALVGGSFANVAAVYLAANFNAGSPTNVVSANLVTILTSTLTRTTVTNSPGTGVASIGYLFLNIQANAGPVDFTIRIGAPQLEQGAFPTSYIPTTSAAVTRAQDSCTIPSANMSWFTPPGGSWATEFITFSPTPGGASTRIVGSPSPGGIGPVFLMAGPVNALGQYDGAAVNTANAASINVIAKGATTWASGNAQACLNGGTVASSSGLTTGYAALVSSGIRIGANATAVDGMTGYIRRVRYWPRVLTNTELQQVTT